MPIAPQPRISSFQPTLEPKVLQAEDFGLGPILTATQNDGAINQPKDTDKKVFIVWDVSLTAGQQQTLFCEAGIPAYWLVSIRGQTGVRISVVLNVAGSGPPIRLSGGGFIKVPGMNEYLTVICESPSTAAAVTVAATRGYPDAMLSGGNLA